MSDIKLQRNDVKVLSKALEWHEMGERACLITVIETWGSSPRPIGAMMSINGDGISIGSVSGGCIEEELRAAARDLDIAVPAVSVAPAAVEASAAPAAPAMAAEDVAAATPAPSSSTWRRGMQRAGRRAART